MVRFSTSASSNNILEKKERGIAFEGELVGQGRDAARQTLKEKPELAEKISKAILEKVTVKVGEPVTGEGEA